MFGVLSPKPKKATKNKKKGYNTYLKDYFVLCYPTILPSISLKDVDLASEMILNLKNSFTLTE